MTTSQHQELTRSDLLAFWHGRPAFVPDIEDFNPRQLIEELAADAMHGCGLHHEIYHACLVRALRDEFDTLPAGNRAALQLELTAQGIEIDDAAIAEAEQAEREVWAEIRAEQA